MSADDTEAIRRALVPTMPDELEDRMAKGERVWTPEEMTKEFAVVSFAAPFVVVRRRIDGISGSLMFTHSPRVYFGWQEA